MKIAALTSGALTPSARFRIRQYLPHLKEAGLNVTEYCPRLSQGARLPGLLGRVRSRYLPPLVAGQMLTNLAFRAPGVIASRAADVTWLERNFVPGLDDCATLLKGPIVLDIDDSIWLYNPLGASMIKRLVRRAEMVFAGNQFLANWCGEYCQNVRIVPTAVDSNRFRPRLQPKPEGAPFVVGWTGTSGNFHFLNMIEPALEQFLATFPSARLLIVADRPPSLPTLPQSQLDFVAWTAATEHLLLHEMDVGIMPIDDTDLSRGKCSFKMLQYMASGLPVIVSPFGMNRDVLSLGEIGLGPKTISEWMDSLAYYCRNPDEVASHGKNARAIVQCRFDVGFIANQINRYFLELMAD